MTSRKGEIREEIENASSIETKTAMPAEGLIDQTITVEEAWTVAQGERSVVETAAARAETTAGTEKQLREAH
jgi:hypothetical protein